MEKEKKEITEEKEVKKEKKKESKGIKTTSFQTTLLVILLIGTAALGGWVVGASKVATSVNANSNRNNSNSTITNNNAANNQQSTETTSTEKEDTIKPLDLAKSLNTSGINYSNPTENQENVGVLIETNGTSTAKFIIKDHDRYCDAFHLFCAKGEGESSIDVNFDKTVKSGFVGGVGQDATGTTVFYLMEDGTVQYYRMMVKRTDSQGNQYYEMNSVKHSAEEANKNHTEGQLGNANGVVKIYSVDASNGMSGYRTVIGATKDGSFYDLGYMIEK